MIKSSQSDDDSVKIQNPDQNVDAIMNCKDNEATQLSIIKRICIIFKLAKSKNDQTESILEDMKYFLYLKLLK